MAAFSSSRFFFVLFVLSFGCNHFQQQQQQQQKFVAAETRRSLLQSVQTDGHLAARVVVVDQNGNGDFTSVQDAVNAVPDGNDQRLTLQISAGIYWHTNKMSSRPKPRMDGTALQPKYGGAAKHLP